MLSAWLVVASTCASFAPPHLTGRHAPGGRRSRTMTAVLTPSVTAVPPWVATPPSEDVWNDEIRAGWQMAYTSVPGEYEYEISAIDGTIPADLKGSLWRNGPGNFERGGQRFEHVLDGDGYLGRISIDGSTGRASFKGRFVRTADFEEEEAADAILKRNTFGTQPEGGLLANAGRLALKNVANTNVITLGGRVLALWEAGMPQRVVPSTMDCEGSDDLGGSLLDGGLVVSSPACTDPACTVHCACWNTDAPWDTSGEHGLRGHRSHARPWSGLYGAPPHRPRLRHARWLLVGFEARPVCRLSHGVCERDKRSRLTNDQPQPQPQPLPTP